MAVTPDSSKTGIELTAKAKVRDLSWPLRAVPHRGCGSLMFPAGPLECFQIGYNQGWDCLDGGDFRLQTDQETLLNAHNPNLSGDIGFNQSAYKLPAHMIRAIPLTISSYYLPAPSGTYFMTTAQEILKEFGGKVVLAIELKTDGSGNYANPHSAGSVGTAFASLVTSMKLQDCVIASAAATAELTPCINAGIATMIVTTGDQSGAPAQATNQAIYNSGVRHIAIDVSAHSSTSVVATYQAMGFRVWGYTVKRQYDADLWLNAGIDALYSDDPLYTNGVTSKYRQTTDDFQTGVFPSGMIPADDGTLNRGTLQYGRWFPKPGKAVSLLGQFSPVPSASNLTFDFTVCIDTVGSDTSRHPDVVCSTDDRYYDAATPRSVNTGYIGFIRLTGAMFLFRTVAGVNTQIGTTSSTATVAPIVLSAGLASGVAITSLSVNALPADVPSGTQFMLPTEQLVTTSALASSGATSISINSVTPSAAVANGTSIPQAIRMRYQQTSTNVILTRLDTSTTLSVADATHRGTYLHAGQNDSAGASGMQTSFCDITVS